MTTFRLTSDERRLLTMFVLLGALSLVAWVRFRPDPPPPPPVVRGTASAFPP